MKTKKYVAYVSTYTRDDNHGINIYDVDMEHGRLEPKGQIEISNSSYMTVSHSGKFLYSITDMGIESFKIEADGMLTPINKSSINGMRGCYLSTDYDDKFLFCAGYHDGKITALRIDPETGAIGAITAEIYNKGLGSIAERSFRPHISCVKMTRDNQYLCAADLGIDYINVYKLDHERGTLRQVDIIRCDVGSAPRHIKFSEDGRFMYVVCELQNSIKVYSYRDENGIPFFDLIQSVQTTEKTSDQGSAASALNISADWKYIIASNAGENSVAIFKLNDEDGTIDRVLCLPISGEYPKDAALFPDSKHLVSLNHESDTMTFFTVDTENKTLIMNGKEMKVKKGNCIIFQELN